MTFVPLRILSAYTMLEGATDPKEIATLARGLGFPAAALTDRNGLYGAMPFSDACAAAGVQPIIGAMLAVARPSGDVSQKDAAKPPAWRKAHRWHPHLLRYTWATEIRNPFDVEAAQEILGHSKPDTTLVYAERVLTKCV